MKDDIKEAPPKSKLSVELYELIEAKINDKIDRERRLIEKTIGKAVKVFLLSLSLIAGVLSFLGFKTLNDVNQHVDSIQSTINDVANKKISDSLAEYSPTGKFQIRMDRLYDQAMLYSYIIKIKSKSAEDIKLDRHDTSRLLGILKNPESNLDQFRFAAVILRNLSTDSSWRQTIGGEFVRLIEADKPGYRFLKEDSERRKILVSYFEKRPHDTARKAIRRVARDDTNKPPLRLAAIKYIYESGDIGASTCLEELCGSPIQTVCDEALLALAKLHPKSKILSVWVNKFKQSKQCGLPDIKKGLEFVNVLIMGHPYATDRWRRRKDPDKKYRHDISKDIIKKIFSQKIQIVSVDPELGLFNRLIIWSSQADDYVAFKAYLILGRTYDLIFNLLNEYAKSHEIEKLAHAVKIISVQYRSKQIGVVEAQLGKNTRLTSKSGVVLDIKAAPKGIEFYCNRTKGKDLLRMVWLDSSLTKNSDYLKEINNADGLSFKLKVVNQPKEH